VDANLRHLHVFLAVARLGSISAAARSVHLSQPAVTQAVAGVERYFGTPLLIRSNAGVALTGTGEICAQRIERALGQLRDGMTEVTREGRNNAKDVSRLMRSVQLFALMAVVEHRNFTRAARARHVSQPAIHRAARDLERLLGVRLFEQTSFGIVPTREADKLARRARLAFAEIAQARAEINALNGGESGHTAIGAMPLARSFLVPSALIAFTQQFPGHSVSIVEGTYEYLLGALRSGGADFLIGALRDPASLSDVVQEHLFDDPLSIVVRSGHPLAGKKRVSVAALSRYPWVAPRAASPLRAHFNNLFAEARLPPPRQPIECNSLIAARALLLESDRVMLLSAHQIHYELKAGLLVALPHPAGNVVRPIGLTMRRDWHPTGSQQRLLIWYESGRGIWAAHDRRQLPDAVVSSATHWREDGYRIGSNSRRHGRLEL
jgi:LysR family transcriptional regulator, regulator for genes of the gallate degradation pathway